MVFRQKFAHYRFVIRIFSLILQAEITTKRNKKNYDTKDVMQCFAGSDCLVQPRKDL